MILDFLLRQNTVSTFDLGDLYPGATGFSVTSSNGTKVSATIEGGVLTVAPGALGHSDLTLTFVDASGQTVADSFRAIVAGPNAYSFAVIPDTQSYTSTGSAEIRAMFGEMIDYIVEHKDALGIIRAIHVGDITDNNIASQWAIAQDAMSRLDGVLEYTLAVGNHDQAPGGSANDFTSGIDNWFTPEQLGVEGTYDGYPTPSLRNSYDTFVAPDGTKWLILSLEFGAPDDVLRWASEVIEGHLDHRVIIDTHSWNGGDKRVDPTTEPLTGENGGWGYGIRNDPRNVNDGEDMWRDLASKYPNVTFTFNGHNFLDGAETVVSETAGGAPVFQMFVNYQNGIDNVITGAGDPSVGGRAGNGGFRLVVIDPDNGIVSTHAKFTALDRFFERVDHQEFFSGVDLGAPAVIAIAKAGADEVAQAGEDGVATVMLDASATILPGDGRALTYEWFAANGERIGEGETLEAALGYGVNRVTLKVTDADGNVSRDEKTVIVEGPKNLLTETFDDGEAQGWRAPRDFDAFELGTDVGFSLPSLGGVEQVPLTLAFDSSFRPYDDQTGRVYVSFDGGESWRVVRTFNTANSGGADSLSHVNERVEIDFLAPADAGSVMFSWRLSDADNDWWWAIDDAELFHGHGEDRVSIWSESFDGLADRLLSSADENVPDSLLGWTHEGPEGWAIENAATMPPGTTEWSGWSFATPEFWRAADQQNRADFTLGDGVIAIADPDEWDDFNGGAGGNTNLFDSSLRTPSIDISGLGSGETGGEPEGVARFAAFTPADGLLVKPELSGLLHEYTLIFDINTAAPPKDYTALYQTDLANTTDADAYIFANGGVGISSVYQGAFRFGEWNRLALVVAVENGAQIMRKYIDGTFVGQQTLAASVGAGTRWSIDADNGFLLFADRDDYTAEIFANAFAFTPEVLDAAAIAALGGADADGPLAGSEVPGAFQLNFNESLDSTDFGSATVEVVDLGAGLGSFLVKGSWFGNPNGEGEAALYAQTNGADEKVIYAGAGATEWTDYVFDMVVHPADNDVIGAFFYWKDTQNHYELAIDQQSFVRTLTKVENGVRTVLAEENGGYRHHAEQDLRIVVGANGIIVTLDEQLLFGGPVVDEDPLDGGTVGVLSRFMDRVAFDEVSVNGQVLSARALGETRAVDLDEDGVGAFAVTAAATISPEAVASREWLIGGEVVATGREAVIEAAAGETELVLRVTDATGAISEDRMTLRTVEAGRVLLAESFDATAEDFVIVDAGATNAPSNWSVVEGAFIQDSDIASGQQQTGFGAWSLGGEGAYLLRDGTYAVYDRAEAYRWSDYAVEVKITPTDDDGVGLLFRYVDDRNFYKFEIDDQTGIAQLIRNVDGYETVLARGWANYAQDETFDLRIEAEGSRLGVWVDGVELFGAAIDDGAIRAGTVALYSWASTGLGFDDLVVTRLGAGGPARTIVTGTEGRDLLTGTGGNDFFEFLVGADTIETLGGVDVLDLTATLANGARDSIIVNAEPGQSLILAGLDEADVTNVVARGARTVFSLGEDGDVLTVVGLDRDSIRFEPDSLLFA